MKHKLMLILLGAVLALGVQAAPWAMAHNARRAPKTLIVVGNYKTPRLMAETILALTCQPYMFASSDGRYFIVLNRVVQEVPAAKLDVYVNKLAPRRIVIIGDERYVSHEMELKLREVNTRYTPIVRIYGDNWQRIAEELDDLLNIGNLTREFMQNNFDMQMRTPRLEKAPTAPVESAPVEPVSAEPVPVEPVELKTENKPAAQAVPAPAAAKVAPAPAAAKVAPAPAAAKVAPAPAAAK